jgi:hypothetical protein
MKPYFKGVAHLQWKNKVHAMIEVTLCQFNNSLKQPQNSLLWTNIRTISTSIGSNRRRWKNLECAKKNENTFTNITSNTREKLLDRISIESTGVRPKCQLLKWWSTLTTGKQFSVNKWKVLLISRRVPSHINLNMRLNKVARSLGQLTRIKELRNRSRFRLLHIKYHPHGITICQIS